MIRTLFAAMLLMWPMTAQAEWHEAQSDHFVVYADDKAANVARFAERLERFDKTLRFLTKAAVTPIAPPNRVTVYVTGDMSSIARLAGSSNVAGFYIPRAGGSVAFVPKRAGDGGREGIDEEQVLFHEYTHHFMLSNWADAAFPAWFVEGFAEFFATTRFRPDGTIEVARAPMYRARSFANGVPISAQALLTGDPARIERSALYAGGWLLSHMLILDPARRGQLDRYITAVAAGQTNAKAAEAFGDLRQLDRDFSRYVRTGLRYMTIPAASVPAATVRVRALRPGEAAMMPLIIRSKRGVNRKAALALLPLVQRAAAPYPNDAAVQVELAEAEYDAGNNAAAEAAARRAVATDPTSIDGHVYIGRARMAAARAAKNADPQLWRDIRKSFLAANAIEADDPEPLMLFYQSFDIPGQKPNTNARDALLRAHLLGPQDRGLRMQAARVLLETDRGAEARRTLGPVAYAPHGGATAAFAAELIAIIDRDGAAAALTRWRNGPQRETDDDTDT